MVGTRRRSANSPSRESHARGRGPCSVFSLQHLWAWFALVEIALYEGHLDTARNNLQRDWPKVHRSAQLRIGPIRAWMNQSRARVALAVTALLRRADKPDRWTSSKRQRLMRVLGKQLRRLGESLCARSRAGSDPGASNGLWT